VSGIGATTAVDTAPFATDGVRDGGCLCGAVRYRAGLPPQWVAHCHCSMCRRAQGAAFVTWVGIAEPRFQLLRGQELLARYHSSPSATRSFCRRCGSPLLFRSTRWPDETHVTLASFDDPTGLEPRGHAYWRSRVKWGDWNGRELRISEPPDHDAPVTSAS
jgi:hypothetical protein